MVSDPVGKEHGAKVGSQVRVRVKSRVLGSTDPLSARPLDEDVLAFDLGRRPLAGTVVDDASVAHLTAVSVHGPDSAGDVVARLDWEASQDKQP